MFFPTKVEIEHLLPPSGAKRPIPPPRVCHQSHDGSHSTGNTRSLHIFQKKKSVNKMISVFALKPSFLFHFLHPNKKKKKQKSLVWGCLILEETSFMEQEGVTLEELKKKMADFAKERDWDQFHSPRNLLLALVFF